MMFAVKVALGLSAIIGLTAVFAMSGKSLEKETMEKRSPVVLPEGSKSIYLAGGCFWCLDAMFQRLKGVHSVESGYAGGNRQGVSYEEVCTGTTGHAETIKINFDPKAISADDLLRIFFTIHDPTTLNRQGSDYGTQYRSAIFYSDEEEKAAAEKIRDEISKAKIWRGKIVTEISPLRNWTPAEDYHQSYFDKYQKAGPGQKLSMNSGYCRAVIEPKVIEFRKKFAKLLKEGQ